jgi:hypothetical protein
MATVATMSPTDVLAREAGKLEVELTKLRANVADEQATLARLKAEQSKLVADIGLKKEPASKAIPLAAEIAGAESVIAGLNTIISPKEIRLGEVLTELRHFREAASKAAAVGEVARLRQEGEAILGRISAVVDSTVRADRERYLAVRHRLRVITATAQMGVFPIPAPALAADEAQRHLDKVVLEKFTPILKLVGR